MTQEELNNINKLFQALEPILLKVAEKTLPNEVIRIEFGFATITIEK